ncbi:ATP-binding cassette domain-containing protein [Haematobacter missouriensis]|uniref:Thiamine ABC transporter ATP-binding protein n=2 Tax=Haematobacter TaxID=366614 RepID=A0A212AVX2_9RHOB|nr:ATP-binding cassette domain-containing protein [Haematobacter missouriensis]OWJ75609.1 thiamine ABC transporter ATP-binding protein [Haematobacter missouriensis]OWJ85632.1 thiamine ABC transporter ATP-binding protein [Haematobacter missouriensis]
MLRLEQVTIRQGDFVLSADFTVEAGRRVAVMGPSGAGKSTLLNAIAGFLPLASGRILWAGEDIGGLRPGARPMTVLFQDNNLFPHLTVSQNVGLGLRPDLRLGEPERRQVAAALADVGLEGLGARRPAALSGGQAGRVALARALLRRRPLLLLDEPFAALGPALREEMLALVARIAAETAATVLMVTHDPADAERLADEVIVVDGGSAFPPRPTAALLADPPVALARYLGQRRK